MATTASTLLKPVDPHLAQIILSKLNQAGVAREKCLKEAGEQLIQWLDNHGRFIQAKGTGQLYYLYRDEHRVFRLDSETFESWLYLVSMVNPASKGFKYLLADCRTAAFGGDRVEVVKLAHWDGSFLRVSSFDGNVWRLDGQTIEQEANGDGPILFDDEGWEPYTPSPQSDGSALRWWTDLLHAEPPVEQYQLGLLAYLGGIFFTELCPTRPILLVKGEKGSGKSMVLRVMLKLLFGPGEDLLGIPDREEAFATAASNTLVMVIDNLDEVKPWLRDKLARMTTGSKDPVRVLHKTNVLMKITFRVWLAVTARTPDTLKRDDLADRLLILPAEVLAANTPERVFLDQATALRSRWWGDVLQLLNRMVGNIHAGKMPKLSPLRMADFEALGRLAAMTEGQEDTWANFVATWSDSQRTFLIEDSVIVDAIEAWLKDPNNRGREIDTRSLYSEAEEKLYGLRPNRPDQNWPKSAVWFGRQLAQIRRSLKTRFRIEWRTNGGHTYYKLDVLV